MNWNFPRSIYGAKVLVELGCQQGLSLEACIEGSDISTADLADPTAVVGGEQELAVVLNLIQKLPKGERLCLVAGDRYTLSSYGIWGYAMLSSPTLRSAAEIGIRYLHLTYAFNRLTLEETDETFRLVLDDREIPAAAKAFLVTRDAAGILTAQRELFNYNIPLRRMTTRFAEPAWAKSISQQFGVEVEFGAEQNMVELDARWLDQPLPQANPVAWELCVQQCQALLDKREARAGFAGQLRDRLLGQAANIPDMETVAAELNITSRTLRRRLAADGVSYRALVDEIRETLAEELLSTAGMQVEAIAERLGYAETASFVHAFKRWKGLPPSRWREARR